MKRFTAVILAGVIFTAIVCVSSAKAETITIGTGAYSWEYPLNTSYYDARTQTIYLAAEIGCEKTLNSLALDVTTIPGVVMNNFTIRMKHTSRSAYSSLKAWESTGWTVVYQSNQTVSTTGWTTFIFSTPFYYDGTQNLMVDISFNNSSGPYLGKGYCRYSTPGGTRSIYYGADNDYGDPLTWSGYTSPIPSSTTKIPNIRLDYAPMVTVPNVVGMTRTAAESAITSAGLAVAISSGFSDTVPAGYVISQEPVADTSVASGTSVNIVVSLGISITVPNVVGLEQSAAESAITSAGLTVAVSPGFSDTVLAGYVISQNPAAGASVASGISVNIVVSFGTAGSYDYSGGSGTTEDPYKIANAIDLLALAAYANDYSRAFILVNDINLAGFVFSKAVIAPDINSSTTGFQGTAFTGVFDGNGHSIISLKIDTGGVSNNYLGLFGKLDSGGIVTNLGTEDVNIIGGASSYIGVLCGYNSSGSIANCYSTGNVSGTEYVGGLCGYNNSGSISNCYLTGTVSGTNRVGGLCGTNYHGSITNCYSTGNVSGKGAVGGLCGEHYSGSSTNCYSTGNVSGTNSVGGLCGYNSSGSIANCYSTGNVSGSGDYIGGLCGWNYSGSSISGSYFLNTAGPNNGYGTPLTDAQMKQRASFVGWDFVGETVNGSNDVWRMCINEVNYPGLSWTYSSGGDFDCPDGVDIYDLAFLSSQWLFEGEFIADIAGGDDIVDFLDFAVLAENWME
ncbi:MAG: PASTA domain-containing protein [Planctomycetaceae bacterium]|nr:PASTA domain-containing protein [Planctomycetaceae bacterium]